MHKDQLERDENGLGSTLGDTTVARATAEMTGEGKLRPWYDLSRVSSDRMPFSPFADPISLAYKPTERVASHAVNGESISGQIGSQGTKIDALGHFGFADESGAISYLGGFTQEEVKPTDDSPLLRLGAETIPPIVTSALLLDARSFHGRNMEAGEEVTTCDIRRMITIQRLRALMPGDVLLIHTGWGDNWSDDNTEPGRTDYYGSGPGLSRDAAEYIASKKIVCVGMDVPFLDPVHMGFFEGTAGTSKNAPAGLPFFIHHYNLTQAGIYQLHNMRLTELAADRVYVSAVFILPIRIRGGSNAPVRPVAIGRPHTPTTW